MKRILFFSLFCKSNLPTLFFDRLALVYLYIHTKTCLVSVLSYHIHNFRSRYPYHKSK